ncbi:MAG: hypothetical protein P8L38_04500 [Gammaproteobacteria bacterium]|nr:hypothetical protein [Gammaproteobacteria bacterium]
MVVVKIGGSLQSTQYIKKWIHEIKLNRNTSFLLVFGGGSYAEKIRKDQITRRYHDQEAHKRAIYAMRDFTKDYLNELRDFVTINKLSSIKKNYKKRKLLVWMPSVDEVNSFDIPLNWDATSDSIALEIAKKTNSPLLVVKSVKFNCKNYINNFFLKDNVLDKYFTKEYMRYSQKISLVSRGNFYKLNKICKDFLNNTNY